MPNMNKRQKSILINFAIVIIITAIAVFALINLKDWINRSEAKRAMTQLGQTVLDYRKTHGSVPSESYVDSIRTNLPGHQRLGNLHYRALWINFDSTPDDILAYTEIRQPSLLSDDGYIVLRLDGRVRWMNKADFKALLAQYQSPMEIEMTKD